MEKIDYTLPTALPEHLRQIEDRLNIFFDDLSHYGNATKASKLAQLNYAWLMSQRKRNPGLRARWELALAQFADVLEAAAFARAVEGTHKPVYQGGVKVGKIKEYSDSLLGKLLEANSKKYAAKQRLELANAEGETFKVEESPTVVARELAFALALGLQHAGQSQQPAPDVPAIAGEDEPQPFIFVDEPAPSDGSELA